jgi:hypothetical protein
MVRNEVKAESYPNSQIPKEGIKMTNRKFSRKRIGQALGLLALSLVLLVGSTGYGSADYGRISGAQQVWALAQQDESPATFLVEATVNRNGGLQVQLPDPPEGPGVFLEVQFVVDGSREPHQLVPRGTIVSIFGIAKEGVTKWSGALAELETLLFFATVGAGQEKRQLFAEVHSSSWSGGFGLDGMATLNIFLIKVLLGLLQQEPLDFSCCEKEMRLVVKPPTADTDTWVEHEVAPGSSKRIIRIVIPGIQIKWKCDDLKDKNCIGKFNVDVLEQPRQYHPMRPGPPANPDVDPATSTITLAGRRANVPCKDDGREYDTRITLTYTATYPFTRGVAGILKLRLHATEPDEDKAKASDDGLDFTLTVTISKANPLGQHKEKEKRREVVDWKKNKKDK